jgi:cysteine synthase A
MQNRKRIMSQIFSNVLDTVGQTRLMDMGDGIFAKCEFENPSGSIKARMAKYMIEQAEKQGLLKPGDTIVEATSGNTGNAMAMIAAVKGYKMIVMIPNGYSGERVKISRGFGAEVRFIGDFHVNQAREAAIELGKKDGYYCPAQFDNEWNVEENREWLGREIISQLPTGVKIDAVVQGVGTGGTLIGVGQALKQWHNPDIKIVAMEPSESRTIECAIVCDHKIEGISDGFIPTIYERHKHLVTDVIDVPGDTAIGMAKKLASTRGLFIGPSSGGNYWAALQLKKKYPEIKNVLTFLCDRGEKYLSHMYEG